MAVKSSAYRYPVSKQHEQVWLLSQMRPDNIAYQFQAEIVFSAGLDKAALLAAMRLLTRRHEGLRTWFDFDTAAEAVVEAELEPHIEERSLRNLAIADARLEMRRDIEAFVCRAVSVDRPPLVLWRLFDLPDGTTTLVHLEHHLVHDGWTFRLFLRELSKTYTDLVLGRAVEMHPAPGYSEYASAQQRWLTSPDADAMRLWWRDALQGISPFLALPNRRPDSEFRMRGEIHECSSSAAQFETFRRIARTHGCSVFQFMFAAYAATLAQISGATAFVVGTSTANRTSSEAEEVIGMYVNMMPIPVRLAEGERFRDFMQHLARTVREALSAGALPFTEIVGTVKPQRVAGELPLMQVCFNFHDAFSDALDLPGVTAEVSEAIPNHAAKFELNLTVIPLAEERGGARLLFEYSTDQYAREDVVAFATEYQAMLDRFARHPEDILRTGSTGLCADGGDDGALLQASTPTLKDVERAVASCAGVASALVIRESDAGDGDGRLAAYVSPIDLSHPPTSQDIAAQLRHRLPEASMPVRIITTSDASWDRSGRTDWKKLMATGIAADVERLPEAVALSAEQTILSVFADLLEGDVDPEDSFFERGGHSLLAARACTRINAVLGSRVGLRDILQWQSARELANLVTQGVTPRLRMNRRRGCNDPANAVDAHAMTRTADATSLETSLWVVANSSDDATALNLTRIYDVGGARPEMVDAALRTLIRRHEALRTGFEVSTDGTLVRRVHDDPPMDVRRIRIAEWDATETEHTIASATRLAAQHRFDLSHPPLMRATLLTLSEGRTLLLLTIHHIVADGWSFSVVEAEMTSLLRCTDLPPRPADADGEIFDRLIARERRERALSTFPAAFATRVAELEASVSPLQFGVLPGREVPNDVNAERLSIIIGDASAARMLRAARTYRTTLFGMILAAFGVLMYKLSGQRRLLVGVPISVREPSAADAVGLFANLLPISIHVQGDRRVADLVAATRDRLLDALEMPLMPFGELVRAVDPSGAGDAHPLCQVAVSWEEFGASRGAAFAATTLVPVTVPFAQSRFAVHVALYRSGGASPARYSTGATSLMRSRPRGLSKGWSTFLLKWPMPETPWSGHCVFVRTIWTGRRI
ncbi:condensation domain-containing protein [Sphingomonas melonis]|uniref:condensation domain-containing protein n=1 Tax=Sphingomonas melonis TaxID=152682 RepID=UPI000870C78D|nr:condensation domain-containing protein [Sphingomonas melonis]AOW24655.1 hypothetical protein BJP26_14630 [Sphingomonas melonis TY]